MSVKESVEFMFLNEAAERLNVSEDAVVALLKAGTLRGFRIGREWRIIDEDLEEFLQLRPKEDLRLFPISLGMKRGKRTLHVVKGEIDL